MIDETVAQARAIATVVRVFSEIKRFGDADRFITLLSLIEDELKRAIRSEFTTRDPWRVRKSTTRDVWSVQNIVTREEHRVRQGPRFKRIVFFNTRASAQRKADQLNEGER